jgi:WD40 repeat protein
MSEQASGRDEQNWERLLADYDDALAAGERSDTVEDEVPEELRQRFDRDTSWCRLVRDALVPTAHGFEDHWPFHVATEENGRPSRLGRFELRGELGRGAFGVVFLAYDPTLRREVALKVPRAESLLTTEHRVRFRQEAQAAANLNHPNIVAVYDAGEVGAISFIATAYVRGETLAEWLQRRRDEPISFRMAASLIWVLSGAIEHAHSRGILHRDLKPGNVLLDTSGQKTSTCAESDYLMLPFTPKITDFGLAKVLAQPGGIDHAAIPTMTGAILGTPGYMAPEQAEGRTRDIGPFTDIHALDVILYELLTGRSPFKADSPLEVLESIRSRDPVAPSRLRPAVPRDLETICLKCLQKEPNQRYADAGSLADELARYLDGKPIVARPVSPARRLAMTCRRNPRMTVVVAGAVLAVTLVASAGVWSVVQERDRYRLERDKSRVNLYRALLGEARGRILTKETGWYWDALDNIREASNTGAEGDTNLARELALQCLGAEQSCMRRIASVEAHVGGVSELALSRDGALVASGGADGLVRVWSADAHALVATLEGHQGPITGLAFFPESRRLASSSRDGTIRIWRLDGTSAPRSDKPIDLGAGPILDLQAALDGSTIAAACGDGTVHVIAIGSQGGPSGPARVLRGHTGPATCLAFSPSGRWLCTGSDDQTIRVWHIPSNRPAGTWLTKSTTLAIGFAPGGEGLFWSERETFYLRCRRIVFPFSDSTMMGYHEGGINKFAMGDRGQMVTASSDGSLKLWRFSWRHTVPHLATASPEPGAGRVTSVVLGPQGNWVVSGHGDGRVRFWEIAESPVRTYVNAGSQAEAFTRGRVLAVPTSLIDFRSGVSALDSTPVGPTGISALTVRARTRDFAVGRDDGTLEIWKPDDREPRARWNGHGAPLVALVSSPDGRFLASAAAHGSVKIWRWDNAKLERAVDAGVGDWQALAWRREDGALAAAGESGVVLWDLHAGASSPPQQLVDRPQPGQFLAFGRDCFALGSAAGTVEIRDACTGGLQRLLSDREAKISVVSFAPDGRTLAVGRWGSPIRIWDASTGVKRAEFSQTGHEPHTDVLDFSPDGRRLAATSLDGPVQVWDMDTGRLLGEEVETKLDQSRFLADGSALVQTAPGGTISLCSTEGIENAARAARTKATGELTGGHATFKAWKTIVPGRQSTAVWGLAASPDGKWFATAAHDGSLVLWDAHSGQRVRSFPEHNDVAWSVAFSHDSRLVAAGSDDIKICEVSTGREVATCKGHDRLVAGLAFHPNRPWLFSGSYDGTVRLWDVRTGTCLGILHKASGAVNGVSIRPDGRWMFACGADGRALGWDLSRELTFPAEPSRVLSGLEGALWSVGFAPDGRTLATGAEHGAIILWDGSTFERLTILRGGRGQMRGVSFSKDGGLLAGSSYQADTVVWDLDRARETLRSMRLDWRP